MCAVESQVPRITGDGIPNVTENSHKVHQTQRLLALQVESTRLRVPVLALTGPTWRILPRNIPDFGLVSSSGSAVPMHHQDDIANALLPAPAPVRLGHLILKRPGWCPWMLSLFLGDPRPCKGCILL